MGSPGVHATQEGKYAYHEFSKFTVPGRGSRALSNLNAGLPEGQNP
jgi:hypothetical protein